MTELEVVFLGTSSATPTKGRNLPSVAIRREGEVVLMESLDRLRRRAT